MVVGLVVLVLVVVVTGIITDIVMITFVNMIGLWCLLNSCGRLQYHSCHAYLHSFRRSLVMQSVVLVMLQLVESVHAADAALCCVNGVERWHACG